jgi:hypothetical protein
MNELMTQQTCILCSTALALVVQGVCYTVLLLSAEPTLMQSSLSTMQHDAAADSSTNQP